MRVIVIGAGEAQDPNFINSAVVVEAKGFRLLIDCGYSVPQALWRRFPDPDAIDAVYFTHHHADHCFGIVPVASQWKDGGRTKPLPVYTTAAGRTFLTRLLTLGRLAPVAKLPYDLTFRDISESPRIGPFRAAYARSRHSVVNHSIRLEAGGATLGYSGDGFPTAATRRLFRGVDALIHECYDVRPLPPPGFHCDVETCLDLGKAVGVRRLFLIHPRKEARSAITRRIAGLRSVALLKPDQIVSVR